MHHSSYDITLTMLEKDCLLYLGPEKFPTRRKELLQKKPSKEISIDQSQLVVKDKQPDLTCPTVTELEVSNALKRRALAFDLVGVCAYDLMAAYHADLLDHLHTPPPRGYSAVSVQQILRADRAAFMFLSESLTSLKRNAANQLPTDLALPNILSQPTVAFHLLPLSGTIQKASSTTKTSNPKKRSRSPHSKRKRWTQRSQRQKSWSKHSSRSKQQSVRNSPSNSVFVGHATSPTVVAKPKQEIAAPKAFICAQSRGAQTPLASRPSLRRTKFHQRLGFTRTADQPSVCIRNFCGNSQAKSLLEIFKVS